MASQGAAKWLKYFKGKQVDTVIKAGPGEVVPVYDSNGKVFTRLSDGAKITVLIMNAYEPKYHISFKMATRTVMGYVSEKYVAKPIQRTHSVQLAAASATTFAKYGKKTTISYMDKSMKVVAFSSPSQIENSIIAGLEHVERDKDSSQLAFLEFFSNGYRNIPWNSEISANEKARYGVYIGELLIGLFFLSGLASQHLHPSPDNRTARAFYIPDDATFSGIDSLVEFDDGSFLPISNKFGLGAKASIFANIMAKGLVNLGKMQPSVFVDLCSAAIGAGVTSQDMIAKRKSMQVIYEYGFRNILQMNIKDPMLVYYSLKSGNLTQDAIDVVTKIKYSGLADNDVLANLPNSVTAFFCRTIAARLNNDPTSLNQMIEILSGKEFWQANLVESKWEKGIVQYRLTSTKEMKIKIIGNKAPITDIAARQGTVNYEIKPV